MQKRGFKVIGGSYLFKVKNRLLLFHFVDLIANRPKYLLLSLYLGNE